MVEMKKNFKKFKKSLKNAPSLQCLKTIQVTHKKRVKLLVIYSKFNSFIDSQRKQKDPFLISLNQSKYAFDLTRFRKDFSMCGLRKQPCWCDCWSDQHATNLADAIAAVTDWVWTDNKIQISKSLSKIQI